MLLVEVLLALILVLTVISTTTDKSAPAGAAAVAIGFAPAAGVLLGGPMSGGAGNPARAVGPRIVSGTYPVWFFYFAGPLLCGAIAAPMDRASGNLFNKRSPMKQTSHRARIFPRSSDCPGVVRELIDVSAFGRAPSPSMPFEQCDIGRNTESFGRHGAKSDVILNQIALEFPALAVDRDEVPSYHHAIAPAGCP